MSQPAGHNEVIHATHQHTQAGGGERWLRLLEVPGGLAGLDNLNPDHLNPDHLNPDDLNLDDLNLDDLNLDGCGLESLPEGLGSLTELRTLSLYHNRLTRLPESVWQLEQLRTLNLAANCFETWMKESAGSGDCRCWMWGITNWPRCPNRWSACPSSPFFI